MPPPTTLTYTEPRKGRRGERIGIGGDIIGGAVSKTSNGSNQTEREKKEGGQ